MNITRRDFLNGMLLGAGAALIDMPAPLRLFARTPEWDGYGGTGDYADSHGNMEEVILGGHGLRDGRFRHLLSEAADSGERYDLVIIGAGLSGLGAAYLFKKAAAKGRRCLILENHPVFGGQAKQNEFIVDGVRLVAPQASNSFVVMDQPGASGYDIFRDLGIPESFAYQRLPRGEGLYFDRTNYGYMLWYDGAPSYGYFFGGKNGGWVKDMWKDGLRSSPYPEKVKKDFMTWRYGSKSYHGPEDFEQWLDRKSYKNYLEEVMGLGPEVTAFVDPVLACSIGFGADVVSAFGAYQVAMPGFQGFPQGFSRRAVFEENKWHSFPGGNDGFSRHFVKWLIPDAISGGRDFGSIMNGRLRPDALDLPGSNVRIRSGCLAANVEHGRGQGDASEALVTYIQDGKARRVRAGSVVMACGSLVSRRIVRDMPSEYADAFSGFTHAPVMVANVAIRNWRFLYRLGLTACRWFGGFGFSCNVRRPMIAGDYAPPLDPDRPAVLSFYIPFYYPGLSAREQGEKGRHEMLATPYAGYEKRLLDQMTLLFGSAGFDAAKDVAGIILNRWGHAFTAAVPGFYFGKGGKPSPRSVIRKKFGRVAFAHSELNGHQHWLAAVEEGTRAAKQLAGFWT